MNEFLQVNIGQVVQMVLLLIALGMAYQALRSEQKFTATRLHKLEEISEKFEERINKMEDIMIVLARQDERIAAMDQRMLAQGKRIDVQDSRVDTVATLINGRLEAINNIVASHTGMLNSLKRDRDWDRDRERA